MYTGENGLETEKRSEKMWKKDQGKWSVRGATLVTGEEEEMWMKRVRRGKELGCRLTDKGPVYNSQGVNSPIHTAV